MAKSKKRKQKKLNKKLFDALSEKAPLNDNPGKREYTQSFKKMSRKIRRHWGRRTPALHEKIPQDELINQALEPQEEYDDWMDFRDGFRESWNEHWRNFHWRKKSPKVKKMIARRKAKKIKAGIC